MRFINDNNSVIKNVSFKIVCPEIYDADTGIVSSLSNPESLICTIGNVTLFIRLIDGEYPDYRQVIPTTNREAKFTLETNEFLAAMKKLAPFAKLISIKAKESKKRAKSNQPYSATAQIVLNSTITFKLDSHGIKAENSISAKGQNLPTYDMDFAFPYLLEFAQTAKKLNADELHFEMFGKLEPMKVMSSASQFVIMPMKME